MASFHTFEVWESNSTISLHTHKLVPKQLWSCQCDHENKALRSLGSKVPSRVWKGLIPLSLVLARYP